jgi:hypothetical protein
LSQRNVLLQKLVVDGHLNVVDRRGLAEVSRAEVTELVKSLLHQHGVFPNVSENGAVYEGAKLTLSPAGIQITWQRAYPWDPFTVAECRTQHFTDVETAVDAFIQSEWSSGIDGIKLS